ncbi:MAG: Lar family restriction alleviation protein [Ignavibacteriae bacterium]|nr:Lar family restriction alleviation protein [Ignavibacteriota bacterium]MCB9216118.1 Lar family restriction alleviation protein [Ignavibacteria bacterium]
MSAIEIKPCPFCGGKAAKNQTLFDLIYVQCYHCQARTLEAVHERVAIELWNARISARGMPTIEAQYRIGDNVTTKNRTSVVGVVEAVQVFYRRSKGDVGLLDVTYKVKWPEGAEPRWYPEEDIVPHGA